MLGPDLFELVEPERIIGALEYTHCRVLGADRELSLLAVKDPLKGTALEAATFPQAWAVGSILRLFPAAYGTMGGFS